VLARVPYSAHASCVVNPSTAGRAIAHASCAGVTDPQTHASCVCAVAGSASQCSRGSGLCQDHCCVLPHSSSCAHEYGDVHACMQGSTLQETCTSKKMHRRGCGRLRQKAATLALAALAVAAAGAAGATAAPSKASGSPGSSNASTVRVAASPYQLLTIKQLATKQAASALCNPITHTKHATAYNPRPALELHGCRYAGYHHFLQASCS
jgi:hypothetical protein